MRDWLRKGMLLGSSIGTRWGWRNRGVHSFHLNVAFQLQGVWVRVLSLSHNLPPTDPTFHLTPFHLQIRGPRRAQRYYTLAPTPTSAPTLPRPRLWQSINFATRRGRTRQLGTFYLRQSVRLGPLQTSPSRDDDTCKHALNASLHVYLCL